MIVFFSEHFCSISLNTQKEIAQINCSETEQGSSVSLLG